MERETREEEFKKALSEYFTHTNEESRQGSGASIKMDIGGFASDLNLLDPLDIPLKSSEENEIQSLLFVPKNQELFHIRVGLGEKRQLTVTELGDEDWVDHGPTVLKALMDIEHSQNPPQHY